MLNHVNAVDISSDGHYVVAGGNIWVSPGFFYGEVVFFKDAWNGPDPHWTSTNPSILGINILDVALSDDGYGVAAVDPNIGATIYYWANALTLSGPNVSPTWINDSLGFASVDMNSNGNLVVAGSGLATGSLHFWNNSRTRTSGEFTWTRLSDYVVTESAISADGSIIVATTQTGILVPGTTTLPAPRIPQFNVFFYDTQGNLLGQFKLDQLSPTISVSGDGQIAVVAGTSADSLHVYMLPLPHVRIGGELTESTIPNIVVAIVAIALASTIILGYRLRKS
jgi:hypothetical protein